ncbi:MAG: TonB family protein [Sphingorhabdus sp.]
MARGTSRRMLNLLIAFAAPSIEIPLMLSPPPIVETISNKEFTTRRPTVVALKPLSGRCSDGPLDVSRVEAPMAELLWTTGSNLDQSVSMRFRIDETGRVLGLKRDSTGFGLNADLTPSLAASRFGPGAPRNECSIIYQPKKSSIADADLHDLIGFSIFAQQRAPKEVFDRISPVTSDCNVQRPAVLLRAYPDFQKIPATTGRPDWSMVKFDIDDSGKPVRLATYGTTGNRSLDKFSTDAVAKTRFAKGAKTGCLYPYWRRGGTLASPDSKELAAYRKPDSNCLQTVEWKYQPALVYPEAFRRRDIEGWAVIAFDLAPWGAVGNVKVVASEPAAEFGEAARQIVMGSSTVPSAQGYSNCVIKVRYEMRTEDRQPVIKPD